MITFINDQFPGSALSGNWSITNPGSQTVAVIAGTAHITGGKTTKDTSLAIKNSGYGKSTLRKYVIEAFFSLATLPGSNNYGVFVGPNSQRNVGNCSAYALIDFQNSLLQIVSANSDGTIGTTYASDGTSMPTIATGKNYSLSLTLQENVIIATFKNLTDNQTKTLNFNIAPTNFVRPNIFFYSFGVAGSTDAIFTNVKVTRGEEIKPDILFIGDSITTGYNATSFSDTYAEQITTNKTIQVAAGPSNTTQDVVDNMAEILITAPKTAFIMIGTNDGGNPSHSLISSIKTAINGAGIPLYFLALPNGGDPSESGTYNNYLATTYPDNWLDIWTDGWDAMEPGDMTDSVHPATLGHERLATRLQVVHNFGNNNLFAGVPAIGVCSSSRTFSAAGVNADNVYIIYLVDSPLKSYIPGRAINGITGFEEGKGYWIVPKETLDFSAFLIPPIN